MDIDIACTLDQLVVARHFVTGQLEAYRMAEKEKAMLTSAVDELCANIIIHGNNQDPAKKLNLSVKKVGNHLCINTCDKGIAFDKTMVVRRTMGQLVEAKVKGGLGLMIIHKATDSFEYQRKGDRNYFYMIKSLEL